MLKIEIGLSLPLLPQMARFSIHHIHLTCTVRFFQKTTNNEVKTDIKLSPSATGSMQQHRKPMLSTTWFTIAVERCQRECNESVNKVSNCIHVISFSVANTNEAINYDTRDMKHSSCSHCYNSFWRKKNPIANFILAIVLPAQMFVISQIFTYVYI